MTAPPFNPWDDWHTAASYASFVRDYPLYQELNQQLVRRARLEEARRVLDVACGTGATARACLERMPSDAELVGIDASAPMVFLAREEVDDPRASFAVAAAASLDRTVSGPFDRALCNAALWQFPSAASVFGTVAGLLEAGGLFVFNVPAERVEGQAFPIHPLQVQLARAIEARTGRPFLRSFTGVDLGTLVQQLTDAGFALDEQQRIDYRGTQKELAELMTIPAMIGRLAPGLSPDERQRLLEEAKRSTDPAAPVQVPWIYFTARRESGV